MIAEPRCRQRNCRFFNGVIQTPGNVEAGQKVICDAFPKGIPDDIAYGDNLHLRPVTGDNGIQYEEEEEIQ